MFVLPAIKLYTQFLLPCFACCISCDFISIPAVKCCLFHAFAVISLRCASCSLTTPVILDCSALTATASCLLGFFTDRVAVSLSSIKPTQTMHSHGGDDPQAAVDAAFERCVCCTCVRVRSSFSIHVSRCQHLKTQKLKIHLCFSCFSCVRFDVQHITNS